MAQCHTPTICVVIANDSAVFRFFVPGDLDLRTRARLFCTVYLIAKFDRPTFSRSEVIVRTSKQTDKQTDATENYIHRAPLCYTGR